MLDLECSSQGIESVEFGQIQDMAKNRASDLACLVVRADTGHLERVENSRLSSRDPTDWVLVSVCTIKAALLGRERIAYYRLQTTSGSLVGLMMHVSRRAPPPPAALRDSGTGSAPYACPPQMMSVPQCGATLFFGTDSTSARRRTWATMLNSKTRLHNRHG